MQLRVMTRITKQLLILATLLGVLIEYCKGIHTRIRVAPDFGCLDGRKYGLFHHRNMAACRGIWEGHIKDAMLCSGGWRVCGRARCIIKVGNHGIEKFETWVVAREEDAVATFEPCRVGQCFGRAVCVKPASVNPTVLNDSVQLTAISYYVASHIQGCYAINAAQNGGICQDCTERTNEIAGIGADCPRIDDTAKRSCLRGGRIDATHPSTLRNYSSCSYRPWMSGVVCCKENGQGTKPVITVSPNSSVRVPRGRRIVLNCQASGNPIPIVSWFKNGHRLTNNVTTVSIHENKVLSKFVIPQATSLHDGLYVCKAENSRGFALSYSSEVSSYETNAEFQACRNRRNQRSLYGGTVVACKGKWKGSVRKASRQLCANGWSVCGVKDRNALHKLPWNVVTSLPGCYAYNAATSNHFACTTCSHHFKGNRMSGIGSGCEMTDNGGASCLRSGRIDVQSSATTKRHSCSYHKGITTGVVCCKKHERPTGKNKRGRKCSPPCGPHSYCSRRGVCKCNSNFKAFGVKCLPTHHKRKACSNVRCLNGGRCKKGFCICPPSHIGRFCEKAILVNFARPRR